MSDSRARRALARAAVRLNLQGPACGRLPPLIFVTDDARPAEPSRIARALPRGSVLIARAKNDDARADLAIALKRVAKEHQLVLLVASDPALASRIGADGIHLPESRRGEAHTWRARRPDWMITLAAHSLRALHWGARVDAVLLSPVYPTASHPGGRYLTVPRVNAIARLSPVPVYAMGGVNAAGARRLCGSAFAGIAAHTALLP